MRFCCGFRVTGYRLRFGTRNTQLATRNSERILLDPDYPGVLDVFHKPVATRHFDIVDLLTSGRPKVLGTGRTATEPAALVFDLLHDLGSGTEFLVNGGIDYLDPFLVRKISAAQGHPDMDLSPALIRDGLRHEKTENSSIGVIAPMRDDNHVLARLLRLGHGWS